MKIINNINIGGVQVQGRGRIIEESPNVAPVAPGPSPSVASPGGDANAVAAGAGDLQAPPDAGIPELPAGAAIQPDVPVNEQGLDPNKRVQHQLHRIQVGLDNGWLSPDQAAALTANVNAIAGQLQSGSLSGDAAKQALDASSAAIFEQKQSGRVQAHVDAGDLTADQAGPLFQQILAGATAITNGSSDLKDVFTPLKAAYAALNIA